MKKVLKILNPSIRTYLGDAFCFSVINDVAFDSGWVYDKYIHLEYTPNDGQVKYADYDYYDFVPDQGVFIKSFIEFPYIHSNQEIMCNQVIQMIDNDEYCFALWDENVISDYLFNTFSEVSYEHGCFIYGYDKEKCLFYTQGYILNNKWEHYTVPFNVFYKAISYCPEKGEIALIGYKLRENYVWAFDYKKMKKHMNLYIKYSISDRGNNLYDLNAIREFFYRLSPNKEIHYPSLYCIYEHKVIFLKRMKYLIHQGYVENNGILDKAKELEKLSYKILLLGIRYNSSFEMQIFNIIIQEVQKFIELEENFLGSVSFCEDK